MVGTHRPPRCGTVPYQPHSHPILPLPQNPLAEQARRIRQFLLRQPGIDPQLPQ